MSKRADSVISEFSSQITEDGCNNSEIMDFFFRQSVLCLLRHERLEDSLEALFHFLRERLPIAYIFFNPPYEIHTYKHVYIDDSGIHFYDNELNVENNTVHSIFDQREIHKYNKMQYYCKSEYMDRIFFEITKIQKPDSPCFYLYFIYNEKIQGSIWIGCAPEKTFTDKHLKMLSLLWDPLFFYHEILLSAA